MPILTPWNQALSVAVSSANSWNTANAQTGQIFNNATTWPYTKANADSIAAQAPTPIAPTIKATPILPTVQPMATKLTTPTPIAPTGTPLPTITPNTTQSIAQTAVPAPKVNSFSSPTNGVTTVSPPTILPWVTAPSNSFLEQSQGMNLAERQALRNQQIIPPVNTVPPINPILGNPSGLTDAQIRQQNALKDIPLTGNSMLDQKIGSLNYDKNLAAKNAVQSYTVAQWDYLKNAWYYANFQPVNTTFTNVIKDIQNTYATQGNAGALTDQQAALIASRNWVSVDEVKNPANIFNQLQMTDQWKQVLWIAPRENQIADVATQTERAKQDLATNLAITNQNLNNQIADTQKQTARTEDFLTASWVWSGANRSSGFTQWLANVQNDANTVISRIQTQLQNANNQWTVDLGRINDDFTKNTTRLQNSLNVDLQKLNQNMWTQLSGLAEQYGINSPNLARQLDAVAENFGKSYMDLYTTYQQQQKNTIQMATDNLNLADKMNTLNTTMANKRYNELMANNWAMLAGTSMNTLANEVTAGTLDPKQYANIKSTMIGSIVANLSQTKQVTTSDMNVIQHMVDAWKTPTEIVASLAGSGKTTRQVIGQHFDPNTMSMVNDIAEVDQFGHVVNTPSNNNQTNTTNNNVPVTNAVNYTKSKEWFSAIPYYDVNWLAIWYGQHSINWVPVKAWDTIDEATATKDLENRIDNAKFNSLVKVPLSESQTAALYSLEHNVWPWVWNFPNWKKIIDEVNAWDFQWASNTLANSWIWTTNAATHEVLPSLVKRRQEEASMLWSTTSNSQTQSYSPTTDKNLTQIGSNEQWGLFLDNTTGKTITGNDAIAQNKSVTPQSTNQSSTNTNSSDLSDSQINWIRWLLVKESTGNFNIKNEVGAAKAITGQPWLAGLTQLRTMMDSYSQNPKLTSNEQKTVQNVINWDQPYSPINDKQQFVLNAIQDAAHKAWIMNWSPTDYKNANGAKLAFSIGKYGQQTSAAATAIDHMNDYKVLLQANGNTQFPWFNEAMNSLKQAFGEASVTNLHVLAGTVWDELAGAYNINTGAGKEEKGSDFAAKMSPEQWAWGVDTQIKLLAQKLKNNNDLQWKWVPWITEDNPQIMAVLKKAWYSGDSSWTDTTNSTADIQSVKDALIKKLKS